MTLWIGVIAASLVVWALKNTGYLIPQRLVQGALMSRIAGLATVALLASLVWLRRSRRTEGWFWMHECPPWRWRHSCCTSGHPLSWSWWPRALWRVGYASSASWCEPSKSSTPGIQDNPGLAQPASRISLLACIFARKLKRSRYRVPRRWSNSC